MSSDPSAYGAPSTRLAILEAARTVLELRGPKLGLAEVAERAGVSRQAVYLHFGDRAGLVLALVRDMDETLDLVGSLAHVHAADNGAELLERAMRLNTEFWAAVAPVAAILRAAEVEDEGLRAAWRDRMRFRQLTFRRMVEQIAATDGLAADLNIDTASALLYAVAHFDPWRELTGELAWSDDEYVEHLASLLARALLPA
jgi:AcrR family transcriptional regulator